jgi:3-oxoacyl-[acyl-carrier protein] reductase
VHVADPDGFIVEFAQEIPRRRLRRPGVSGGPRIICRSTVESSKGCGSSMSDTAHPATPPAAGAPAAYRDLAGKVAVVTGGSRGLGAAVCRALAANGAKIAVNGRDRAAVDVVVQELNDGGARAVPAVADCTDSAALAQMRTRVEEQLGPVDVLAAFAGGGRPPQPIIQITEQEWRADVDGNLTSTFLTVKTFLPGMIDRRRGSIITVASMAARQPGGAPIAYAAAKAGVIVFSQQVAHEVGPDGVRVNCLSPAAVVTERMEQAIPADRQREMARMYPLRRLGVPDDVAQATLFLASDASSWITGVTLDIAGGRIMS